jgi:subtilase family serine protease
MNTRQRSAQAFLLFLLAIGVGAAQTGAARLARQAPTTWFRGQLVPYEVRDGLAFFQDDILLGTAEEARANAAPPKETPGATAVAVDGDRYRWPGGVVPYVIDTTGSTNTNLETTVLAAISHWETRTSYRFVRYTLATAPTGGRVVFSARSTGCFSPVGRQTGAMVVNLERGCLTGQAIHEIGHSIGLQHEQSREDRNRFVIVQMDNVEPGKESNFVQTASSSDLGAYDYASIMHYESLAFSINGAPTIVSSPPGIPFGQRVGLSLGEIAAANSLIGISSPAWVTTNPEGLEVNVDGVNCRTPCRFSSWISGSRHTLDVAATQQTVGSTRPWYFVRWNGWNSTFRQGEFQYDAATPVMTAQFSNTVPDAWADLVVTSTTLPASAAAGESVRVEATVENRGRALTGGFQVAFYLSPDSTILPGTDVNLEGTCTSTDGLSGGGAAICSATIRVPSGTSNGNYYIGAFVDDGFDVIESNEFNNASARALQVGTASTYVRGAMVSPVPGSVLPGSGVTFSWSPGAGPISFHLEVGSTAGGRQFYSQNLATARSAAVTGLPVNGSPVYVRLWSQSPAGAWEYSDYTYTAAGGGGNQASLAVMTSPAPGTVLTGGQQTFQWAPGNGAASYHLRIGTNSGSGNVYDQNAGTGLSATVNGLPTGGTIFVQLWTLLPGGWANNEYVYTMGSSSPKPNLVVTRLVSSATGVSGGDLTGVALEVQNVGNAASGSFRVEFHLSTDSNITASDIFTGWYCDFEGLAAGSSTTCAGTIGVPSSISPGTYFLGASADSLRTVDESNESDNARVSDSGTVTISRGNNVVPAKAVLTTPAAGSTLPGPVVAFEWDAGVSVSSYHLRIGTAPGGSNLYDQNLATRRTVVLTGLPVNGSTIYVQLWSELPSGWAFNEYTFRAAGVASLPDLSIVSFAGPTRATSGTTVAGVTTVAINRGNVAAGPFHIGFYLSTDPVITASDIYTGWGCDRTALAVNTTTTCNGNVGIPASVAPGVYYLGVVVDDRFQADDSDRGNNALASQAGVITIVRP